MVLMANCFAWLKNRKKPVRDVKLVIVGLDDAGKTTTVACLQGEPPDGITPTMGFSNAKLIEDKWNVTLYDLGGGNGVRTVWKKYYAEIYGIIFTVDSVNKERLVESKAALCDIFEDSKVTGKPIIVFANKQDKEGALDKIEITKELDLQDLSQRYGFKFNVFPCSALKGYGKKIDQSIKAGFKWLLHAIEEDYTKIHDKVEKEYAVQREEEAKERRERMERIRKLREEREKAAKEAGVEEEEEEEEDDDVVTGNPFRKINDQIIVTETREKKEKQKQKKIKAFQENKDQEQNHEEIEIPIKKKTKKNKSMKKTNKYEQDEDDEGENENEDDTLQIPKITLKGATPENSDVEIVIRRTLNFEEDGSGLSDYFDDLKGTEKTPKKKKKKKSSKKKEDDFERETASSNVIVVGSSENVKEKHKDEDDYSPGEKLKRKKKKKVVEKYDEECDEGNQGDSKRGIHDNTKTEKEIVNDSRAELFRARSQDNLDGVDNESKTKTKKKKKKKMKVATAVSDDSDDDYDEKILKKKKSKKNKTTPTSCQDDEPQLPPIQRQKLPPLRENGHVSKLQPIELRGRLPDIGKTPDFNGQPSGSLWYKRRPNGEDDDIMT